MKKQQPQDEWMVEFINRFNSVMVNTAVVNNTILKLAEQLDTAYIMMGALKITTAQLLEKRFDIPHEEFNKQFEEIHKEIMSGRTILQDDYLKSVKEIVHQHHELIEMIESLKSNPKIAEA